MSKDKQCTVCGNSFQPLWIGDNFCTTACLEKLESKAILGKITLDNEDHNNLCSLRDAVRVLMYGNGPTHALIKDLARTLAVIDGVEPDDDANMLLNLLNVADAAKAALDRMRWTMAGDPCPTCDGTEEKECAPNCRLLELGKACAKLERDEQ